MLSHVNPERFADDTTHSARKLEIKPGSTHSSFKKDPVTGKVRHTGWTFPLVDQSRRRERRIKGVILIAGTPICFLICLVFAIRALFTTQPPLTFLAWLPLLLTLYLTPSALRLGSFSIRDTKYIPEEVVYAPEPLDLVQDEIWRQPTSFRYLEELKESIERDEVLARRLYENALIAYEELLDPELGYTTYQHIPRYAEFKKDYLKRMPILKERADRIFAGDVGAEVVELELKISQLKRQKADVEQSYVTSLRECQINKDSKRRQVLEKQRCGLQNAVKDIDLAIIKLESEIRGLKGFASSEDDERKMATEQRRFENEIRFDTRLRLTRNTTGLDEIIKYHAERTKQINNDRSLSDDAKKELLDKLEAECARNKRELTSSIEVYEGGS